MIPRFFRIPVFFIFIILFGVSDAYSKRAHMPMGNYIRESELIVIADAKSETKSGLANVIFIKEVLKGDQNLKGTELVSSSLRKFSTEEVYLLNAQGIAILFKKDWSNQKDQSPLLEVYQKPEELEALRALVKVYKIPNERKQLLALWDVFNQGNAKIQEQFFADLQAMKNPNNFKIITDVYARLNPTHQRKLVEILGEMGDLRAVQTLIKAMASGPKEVSEAAAQKLYWYYRGAPGVDEAFKQVLDKENLRWYTTRYFAKQTNDPNFKEELQSKETRAVKAERLSKGGNEDAARKIYFEVIEGKDEFLQPETNDYCRRQAALKVLPTATSVEKDRIRKAMLPLLSKDAATNNYLTAKDAAIILRSLQHPDCLIALIDILHWDSSIYWEAAQIATMAIHELAPDARSKAVQQISEWLKEDPQGYASNPQRYLLELIWLGNEEEMNKAEAMMRPQYKNLWMALSPLRSLNQQQDEISFLISVLENSQNIGEEPRQWTFARLSDFSDPMVVEVLAKSLKKNLYSISVQTITEALIKIGGPKVEEEMMKLLLQGNNENNASHYPAEVLFRIKGESAVDLARRMMREINFGSKQDAIIYLGHFGMPEDLKILLPFCDYWASDRQLHYWAMSAVSEIRDRYNYY